MIEIQVHSTKVLSPDQFIDLCKKKARLTTAPKYSIGAVVYTINEKFQQSVDTNKKMETLPLYITGVRWHHSIDRWVYSGWTVTSNDDTVQVVESIMECDLFTGVEDESKDGN